MQKQKQSSNKKITLLVACFNHHHQHHHCMICWNKQTSRRTKKKFHSKLHVILVHHWLMTNCVLQQKVLLDFFLQLALNVAIFSLFAILFVRTDTKLKSKGSLMISGAQLLQSFTTMLGTLLPRQSSEGGKKQFVRNWQSEFLQFNVRNIGIAHRQSRQNNFPTMQPHNTKYSAKLSSATVLFLRLTKTSTTTLPTEWPRLSQTCF